MNPSKSITMVNLTLTCKHKMTKKSKKNTKNKNIRQLYVTVAPANMVIYYRGGNSNRAHMSRESRDVPSIWEMKNCQTMPPTRFSVSSFRVQVPLPVAERK